MGVKPGLAAQLMLDMEKKINEQHMRIAELESTIRAMHAADDAYGCGFYSDDSWRSHYQRLRELVGMPSRSL